MLLRYESGFTAYGTFQGLIDVLDDVRMTDIGLSLTGPYVYRVRIGTGDRYHYTT